MGSTVSYRFLSDAIVEWHHEDVEFWHVCGGTGCVMVCCRCVFDGDLSNADCVVFDGVHKWLLFFSMNDCLQSSSSALVPLGFGVVYSNDTFLLQSSTDIWFCNVEQPFVFVDSPVFVNRQRLIAASVKAAEDIREDECLCFALAFLCNLGTSGHMLSCRSFANAQSHGSFGFLRFLQMYKNMVGDIYTEVLYKLEVPYILDLLDMGYVLMLGIDSGVRIMRPYGEDYTNARHAVCVLKLSEGFYILVDPSGAMAVPVTWLSDFLSECMDKTFVSKGASLLVGVRMRRMSMTYDDLLFEVKAVEDETVVKVEPYTGDNLLLSGYHSFFKLQEAPEIDVCLNASDCELSLRNFYEDNVRWFLDDESFLRVQDAVESTHVDFVGDKEAMKEISRLGDISRDLLFPLGDVSKQEKQDVKLDVRYDGLE